MAKIEERVEELLSNTILNLGYELYDVEYVKEGKDFFLRIYIDNSNGISLEDCEKVSNIITEILDKEDPIQTQYFLEVSSPGVERILKKEKHLKQNLNSKISIKLFKAVDKQKEHIGILEDFNKDFIILNTENKKLELDRKNIAQIKTIYNW